MIKGDIDDSDYHVDFSPALAQIAEIEKWLIEEHKTGSGFYCNWNVIQSHILKGNIAIISFHKESIGFITWRQTSEYTARIEIAEINPDYRRNGAGRKLVEELLLFFKNDNIKVVDLKCSPEKSEFFWKSVGFKEFPDPPKNYKFNPNDKKRLYHILTDFLIPNNAIEDGEVIELWNNEPHATDNNSPTYIWDIRNYQTSFLPIIHPAHYEWRLRWKRDGRIIFDDKIKRFKNEIDFGNFIIIKELL